jgi:hypothetical protein
MVDMMERWCTNFAKSAKFPKARPRIVLNDGEQFVVAAVEHMEVIGHARIEGTSIVVVAASEEMPNWEGLVRTVDVR